MATALVLLALPAVASAASGRFDRTWGQGVDTANPGTGFEICTVAANCTFGLQSGLGGSMTNPDALAVDGAGNVYVVDSNSQRIEKFDAQGNWERAWGKDVVNGGGTGFEICTVAANCQAGVPGTLGGEMFGPEGVAADSAGHVYVADTQNHRIQEFDSQGNFVRAWGVDVVSGNPTGFEVCTIASTCKAGVSSGQSGGMGFPLNVGVDGAGTVFVADLANERIDEFDPQGNFLRAWGKAVLSGGGGGFDVCLAGTCQAGSNGSLGGELNIPKAVVGDQAGNVFVSDFSNNRIQEFDAQGNWERAWGKDVVNGGGTGFEICTVAANCQAGATGGLGGELNQALGLAVDGAGKVYVADAENQRIDRFDSLGNWERAWGTDVVTGGGTGFEICTVAASCKTGTGGGALGGEMSNPGAVAVDAAGNAYVADANNNRIQKFSDPVLTVQKSGTGAGSVTSSPAGIDCGAACSLQAEVGAVFTLSASPAPGSTFSGWSGAGCTGAGTCTVTMADSQTVLATFTVTAAPARPAPPAPPNTRKLRAKINQKKRTARFTFKGSGNVTGFQCKLTGQSKKLSRWRKCKSPVSYRHLKRGKHVFYVRAVGPGGHDPTPAKKRFRIH